MDSNIVHVSQFFSCSKINYACELYYICELGKYLFYNYKQKLSLDGVILVDELKNSKVWEYFRLAIDEGWVCETYLSTIDYEITIVNPLDTSIKIANKLFTTDEVEFDREDWNKRREIVDYDFKTPLVSQISFHTQTDELWIWDINGKDSKNFSVNNKAINDSLICYCFISLIAYVAVERLKTGKPRSFAINIVSNLLITLDAFSYIYILSENSNCLTGWFMYSLDDNILDKTRKQLGYRAWYTLGQDKGLLDRFYTYKEKKAYMKKLDIRKGDFVMLYERNELQKENHIKEIDSCKLAIIDSIDGSAIKFTYFNTTRPMFHQKYEFDDNTTIVKSLYSGIKPYEKLRFSTTTLDINDVGVEYLLYNERYFIVPLDGADDLVSCWVSDGERVDHIYLTQNNLIYWIMMDYDYPFNMERFIKKYFPNEEPVYDIYMRGEGLDPALYVKDDEEC